MWKRTIIFYCFVALRCLFLPSVTVPICFFLHFCQSIDFCILCVCVCAGSIHSAQLLRCYFCTTACPRLNVNRTLYNGIFTSFKPGRERARAQFPPTTHTYPWKWFIKNSFIKRNSYHFRWFAKWRWRRGQVGAVVYNLQAKMFTSKMHIIDIFYVCRTCVCVCVCHFAFNFAHVAMWAQSGLAKRHSLRVFLCMRHADEWVSLYKNKETNFIAAIGHVLLLEYK